MDQFEELLTQTTPTERARFTELLRPALTGSVHVVATLRPEFLDQLLVDPELAILPTRTYTLRPLRREALRAVIEKPARLAGIDVDDGLADRLVDDTDSGEALPLLAFTLAQLADGITRGGRLSAARYDQLGGVQGGLARQADAALTDAVSAGGRSHEQVIAGLLRLVTVDEQGRPTKWRVLRDELPTPVIAELNSFVARRLLTTDTDNGTVVIGVAHEAFLSAWPPLAQAITASVSALRARRAVEYAASEWSDNGRSPERLWAGGQLAAAVTDTGARLRAETVPAGTPSRRAPSRWLPRRHRVLVTDRVDLSPQARDFLHISIRRDHYRRRRSTTVLSVLLVLALAGMAIAVDRQGAAQERQLVATSRQLIAQAETALESDPRAALRLGIAAQRIHPGRETQSSLFSALTTTPYAGTLTGHTGPVNSVGFSPDGAILATGSDDGTVILWDRTGPAPPRRLGQPLTGHTYLVTSVAFAAAGHILATGSADRTVILWDLTDPAQPRRLGQPLTGHTGHVLSVAFTSDGTTLATAGEDGNVILWDLTDPAQPRRLGQPLPGDASGVRSVAFSPDGVILATLGYGTVILWDLNDPAQPHRLGQAKGALPRRTGGSVAFAPDGRILATSDDSTVILWDLTDPAQPRLSQRLTGHNSWVTSVAFTANGTTLATGSWDRSVILWNLDNPAQPRPLGPPLPGSYSLVFAADGTTMAAANGNATVDLWQVTDPARPHRLGQTHHSSSSEVVLSTMALTPDGHLLATAGSSRGAIQDNSTILWDLTDPTQPRRLGQPLTSDTDPVGKVRFSPDGRILATAAATASGLVTLWDVTDPARPRRLGQTFTSNGGYVLSMEFSPDGRTLATGNDDSTVTLWDLTNPAQPRRLGQTRTGHISGVYSVAFTPDGTTLATSSLDNTVILWDVTNPAQPRRLGQTLTSRTINVSSVAFSPDGTTLAISSAGNTVLWDVTDPAQPRRLGQPLTGHISGVSSVAFTPDGTTLATAGFDTLILWNLTHLNDLRNHAVERACSIVGNGLSRDDWAGYIPELPYQDTCPG